MTSLLTISKSPANASSGSSTNVVTRPFTSEDICKRIRSIANCHITLLGMMIVRKVLNSIGPIRKAYVMMQVRQKQQRELDRSILDQAITNIDSGETAFLSDQQNSKFMDLALTEVRWEILRPCIIRPQEFLNLGICYKLSDSEPMGLLAKYAKELNIKLTADDVPSKYHIKLKINEGRTKAVSELVFDIIQESESVEFSTHTVTTSQLEQELIRSASAVGKTLDPL